MGDVAVAAGILVPDAPVGVAQPRQPGDRLGCGGVGAGGIRGEGPLARQVRADLLLRMRSGDFADGRLPPEAPLARELGVSRATMRAALQSLEEDGVISRRRRHGTMVNQQVLDGGLPLNRLVSFRELVERAGHAATVDPLVRTVGPAPADAARALRLTADEDCLHVERLLRAGGAPAVKVTDVLALRWLTVAPDEVADAESTFAFIVTNTAATVDHSLVEIVPRTATADEPRHLGLHAGTPYVELRETLFSPGQEPVAFSRIAVDDTRVRLNVARRDA